MHKARAGRLVACGDADDDGRMEAIKGCVADVAVPVGGLVLQLAGALLAAALVTAWCLLVLVLTGRLPWFVRKYF